ncbi:MAG: hypothetical protein ABFQ65_01505 [Nanoarchaeota archaeon]
MNENKLVIVIKKPIQEVFEFTTNPKNTHLWIPSIDEEIAEEYPPKIGTTYKNRRTNSNWNEYKVVEFEPNKLFTLTEKDDNYSVKYIYRKIDDTTTKLIYFELVKDGELEQPFTQEIFNGLKQIMEQE